MDPLQELVDWATSRGVRLNGIKPERIPGRGIGVVATRDIQANEIVLDVPTNCLRTLSTVPKARLRKLAGTDISVHGILAAELALDTSREHEPWDAVTPRAADFASTPLTWAAEWQALLPPRARELLAAQTAKLARDWECAATAFPELRKRGDGGYRHAWLLVNSRTFYYLDAALKRRRGATRDDHMALQPVADLFNHGDEGGCHAAFGGDGFAFRATAPHAAGDEVRICYGRHGGDALLVEYGFVPAANCWDEAALDDAVLPRLDAARRRMLDDAGFLGRYALDRDTVCHRTQVALRLLCCAGEGKEEEEREEWARFVDGRDDGEASQPAVDALLLTLLREYKAEVDGVIDRVKTLEVSGELERGILIERWLQIRSLLETRIAVLEQESKA
ncbi:putative set domain-containing protein [Rosellinia necatrix]|uniref:Putative set domain-containing protein n=1 Tax=Rosellinia necatrix TaxID=77044 RepID=A0A1W2TW97_ROSNE|nr:putative set domain-containing protein [Rosellinia necatrix]